MLSFVFSKIMPRCSMCNYYSDKSWNVKTHEKTHSKEKKLKSYNCQLCGESVSGRDELNAHFTSVHNIVISNQRFLFDNENSFFSWKKQVEKDSLSRFVRRSGVIQHKTHKTAYYYCHRDGFFSPQGVGKRLKRSGSNKIDTCCPARITVTTNNDTGSVDVEFIGTHVGHNHELSRLRLSENEREEIASKIAKQVEFNGILEGDAGQHPHSESLVQNDANYVEGLVIDAQNDTIQAVDEILIEVCQQQEDVTTFETRKKIILDTFREALEFARSMDDLDICENAARAMIPTMKVARPTDEEFAAKSKIKTRKKESSQKGTDSAKIKRKKTVPS